MSTFEPLSAAPEGAGQARYIHIVGATVWVDDAPADESWPRHVVGMVDGACWEAVDGPAHRDPTGGGGGAQLG